MGGQSQGPSLGRVLRLGYRRSNADNASAGYEDSAAMNEDDWQVERNSATTAAGTIHSTAQPAWSAARRAARRATSAVAISTAEWKKQNDEKCKRADVSRHKSARARAEAEKLRSKEEAETEAVQEKADHRLKERLEETVFWSEEVEGEVVAWEEEKHKLSELRHALIHANSQTSQPARLADRCIRQRASRIGPDQVLDEVEENLILEMENIRLWQHRFNMAVHQMEFQQAQNHSVMRSLNRDLGTKARAAEIDSSCSRLSKRNNRLTLHTGVDMVAMPASWQTHTQAKIDLSRKTREWSQQLRSDVESLVRSALTDLTNYWKKTNAALRDHVENLKHSIQKVEERLTATLQELDEQGRNIEQLRAALAAKGPPLKLAQTRLAMRTQRLPRGRLAWEETDESQNALVGEVTKILDNIQLLNNQLRKAEATHKELSVQKTKLDYDLHVKTVSLQIDEAKCLGSRTKYPMRLKGTWQKVLEGSEKDTEPSGQKTSRHRQDSGSSDDRLPPDH